MTQPDMNQILAQAQEMQAKFQEAQAAILAASMVGEAGNGLVKVTMQGNGSVTNVEIDPQAVDPSDVETLQDLIMGAFADAHKKIGEFAESTMGPLSAGLNDPLGQLF
ncbi:YbaB/EbfC family nucleoid-associated protein [Corynebacterium sp. 13CS0277]|uniref:YbaB/EbfC family nucleoid-associated protein n=1 Tax=Corynebacterium sp. 13CS0277 TaxID=2071994 RepID=UPI000D039C15|nr:YbaB/EbfC family nucleoid-associated protein [Corynebacterium sp. 13CS0277]PRQ12124.1 YbaB/EbfC family nucleoid-associated protein [Corynebacterium sp. 13CS0277]